MLDWFSSSVVDTIRKPANDDDFDVDDFGGFLSSFLCAMISTWVQIQAREDTSPKFGCTMHICWRARASAHVRVYKI